MRYVVTGAAGFAGRYLVQHLQQRNHDVVGLDRRDVDLLDRKATVRKIGRIKPDGIFHLAAPSTSVGQSWKDPEAVIDANLETTLSVLTAAKDLARPPRVLFVSSAEVLGGSPKPLAESQTPNPGSPYALSKLFGEASCHFYHRHFSVPTLVVRAFNHIGPGQAPHFVMPSFALQIAAAEQRGRGTIKVGNLTAKRDFSDVRDMVRAYDVVMRKGKPGETYHAGTGTARSIRDLLEGLLKLSPATIKVVRDTGRFRPNDDPLIKSNPAKLKKLGWQPEIPIEQTLTDILNQTRADA